MLLSVVFSLEAVCTCTPAPLILAVEKLIRSRRKVYRHMTFEVVSARADVAAAGM